MNKVIFARRLTLFTNQFFEPTEEVRNRLFEVCNDYCIAPLLDPREGGFIAPQPINAAPPIVQQPWILQRGLQINPSATSFRIMPMQIDLVSFESSSTDEEEKELCKNLIDQFKKVMSSLQSEDTYQRMAYCPVIGLDNGATFEADKIIRNKYSIPELQGSLPLEVNVSMNYLLDVPIGENTVKANCVCSVSNGSKKETTHQNSMLVQCIILNVDFNTKPENASCYSISEFLPFATKGIETTDVLIKTLI